MSVITISGEFGSEASKTARRVAQALDYHYVDRVIIEKILDEYGLVQFKDMYESMPSIWARFDTLRCAGGISGFPSVHESPYDLFDVGHAGTAIATAV